MFAVGDRVRLLKSHGNAKAFAPAGSCGKVTHMIHGGASALVTFDSAEIRDDYLHAVPVEHLEFESDLDKFARGLA